MAVYASTSGLRSQASALVKVFPAPVPAGGNPRPASGQLWPRGVPAPNR